MFCALVDGGPDKELVFWLYRCGSLPPFPENVLTRGTRAMGDEHQKYCGDLLPRAGFL